ncbi:MAG: cytochrome d ubiquinol oxidase subunit II [Solirubrobacterales bacterium]|nr:cytochrome d ubiquinol oxidase subunit II [Solirubrobacterales bacterium]
MLLQALPLVFVLAGLVLYMVLGGADFGAGFWQLFAGRGRSAQRVREHAHHSMGPVWEANHVWLIFVLTVFWTASARAFASIASTLAVPLFIAAIGIVFRGTAYALRAGASSARESAVIDTIFSLSSILTPFALGAALGAIATNRVPVGNAAGHPFSSWLNPTSIFIGVLAVTSCAYLAAVYLAADAAQLRDQTLERDFRRRALGAGLLAGAVAIAGLAVLASDDHTLYHSLLTGIALPAVIASLLVGLATLALVYTRRFQAARYTAAAAVGAIVAGWALARWPMILPGLTVYQAAAGHDTLVWVIVVVLACGAIVLPSLGILFGLTLTGRFQAAEGPPSALGADGLGHMRTGLLARAAVAFLIAGVGLLNFADADWTHAVGLVCLLGFAVAMFAAVVFPVEADANPQLKEKQMSQAMNGSDEAAARMLGALPGSAALGRGPMPEGDYARHEYHHPAAGWGAVRSVANVLEKSGVEIEVNRRTCARVRPAGRR